MIPIKYRAFIEWKIRDIYALKWQEDWLFVMVDYGWGLVKTYPIDNVELMQSTWLLDKNGKEIYRWDILQSTRPAAMKYKVIRSDEYVWYLFEDEFKDRYSPYRISEVVIIGNIYENPDII